MRDGLSQTHWGGEERPAAQGPSFKYLDEKVLEEETQDENASVTVKVRLFVVIGEVVQVERYTLMNVQEHRLIDDQQIHDDQVIGRTL